MSQNVLVRPLIVSPVFKVVLGPVSHLYFDHPYEPNPEENGLYWATRFTDTRKVFSFEPENIYRAIQVKKTGDPISQFELCGRNRERCPRLWKPENIKGRGKHFYDEKLTFKHSLMKR